MRAGWCGGGRAARGRRATEEERRGSSLEAGDGPRGGRMRCGGWLRVEQELVGAVAVVLLQGLHGDLPRHLAFFETSFFSGFPSTSMVTGRAASSGFSISIAAPGLLLLVSGLALLLLLVLVLESTAETKSMRRLASSSTVLFGAYVNSLPSSNRQTNKQHDDDEFCLDGCFLPISSQFHQTTSTAKASAATPATPTTASDCWQQRGNNNRKHEFVPGLLLLVSGLALLLLLVLILESTAETKSKSSGLAGAMASMMLPPLREMAWPRLRFRLIRRS
nr:uncharacterized protein LOC107279856 [Oryza sativa Japonica Group]